MNPLESRALRYRVGNIEIDAGTSTVRRAGRELSLQPKVFGVLQYLLEHRDRVISKSELLLAIWQGEEVHESTVPWSIGHVRDALGQRRGARLPIETVHRRGYRFAATVEVIKPSAELTDALTDGPVTAPIAPMQAPFVGRARLMAQLQATLESTAAGQGRLCIVQGVPGIGKTRLALELGQHASRAGFQVFSGRSLPDGGSPSFWPWIQILRGMQRSSQLGDAPTQLRESLEAIAQPKARADNTDPSSTRDDRAARFWLLDNIIHFLIGAGSQSAPLLLCIDDVHWADEGTISLLSQLAPELAQSRVLVLVTERRQRGTPRSPKLARMALDAERFELSALSSSEVGAFIARTADLASPPAALAQAVHAATNGNPLFVQETVRELLRQYGQRRLPQLDPALVRLPASTKDVLSIGLRALEEDTRSILRCASVLGSSFELPILQTLSELPTLKLLKHLEAAQRVGVLVVETPQRYRFSHALLHELVYDELAGAERATWHLKAGETLETWSKAEPRYAEIALHFYRALPTSNTTVPGADASGSPIHERAAVAALAAARAAEQVLEHGEAARFYEWALEAQSLELELTPRARAELLFVTGRAQRFAGSAERCRNTLERMFELARQHGWSDLLLRGARVLRPTFAISVLPDPLVRAALEDVIQLLDKADAAADPAAPANPQLARQRVLALSQLSCIPPYSSDLKQSKQLSEQALTLARSLGQTSALLEALRACLYSLSGPDDIDALLRVADEMLELERDRPSYMTLEAHSARAGALIYRGEQAAADQALAAFGRLAEELQLPEAAWYYGRQRAQGCILRGDFDSGIAAIAELSVRGRRLGLGYGQEFLAALQRRVRHDFQAVADPALLLEEHSLHSLGLLDFIPNMRAQKARFAAESGELASAQTAVDWLASQGFEKIPKEISYLNSLVNIAIAVTKLGDLERAEQLYTLLSPYAQFNTPDAYLCDEGSVSHYLALLAATLGWHERVEAHFRSALVLNRDLGRRPQLARTYYDFAVWTAEQDHSGASAQAQSLAREASLHAEAIGMQWLAQLARGLMT
jgi:DNA-binding winged helix-turn-helix (wHTH) protein